MKSALFAALLAGICTATHAQYDPGATGQLGAGMGQAALQQSTLSGTRQMGGKGQTQNGLSPTMRNYCTKWPTDKTCIKLCTKWPEDAGCAQVKAGAVAATKPAKQP